jgi:hypothetical protein
MLLKRFTSNWIYSCEPVCFIHWVVNKYHHY